MSPAAGGRRAAAAFRPVVVQSNQFKETSPSGSWDELINGGERNETLARRRHPLAPPPWPGPTQSPLERARQCQVSGGGCVKCLLRLTLTPSQSHLLSCSGGGCLSDARSSASGTVPFVPLQQRKRTLSPCLWSKISFVMPGQAVVFPFVRCTVQHTTCNRTKLLQSSRK